MINYDCKSILFILLKKWYIVLIAVALTGGLSIPLAKTSYQRAEDNYEQLVVKDEEKNYSVYAVYAVEPSSTCNLKIYSACLNDVSLMESVCRMNREDLSWSNLLQGIVYTFDLDKQELTISMSRNKENEIKFLLDAVTIWLGNYLEENAVGRIVFNEMGYCQTELVEEPTIVSDLLEQPTGLGSRTKTVITAAIFGGVLGCFVVLLWDYIIKNRKWNNEEISNS